MIQFCLCKTESLWFFGGSQKTTDTYVWQSQMTQETGFTDFIADPAKSSVMKKC